MKTHWNVDAILELRPCHDREKLEKFADGRTSLTTAEIAELETVPARDRVWFLLSPDVLSQKQREAVRIRVLTRAITNHALHCGHGQTETWADNWLDGTDRTRKTADAARFAVLAAARDAEWNAVWAAARDAVWAAARDAAQDAARFAVSAAAQDAAQDSARFAVWAAARDAENQNIINDVLFVLGKQFAKKV